MEKRIKSGLAVTPTHLHLCDSNLALAKVDSRNDFVEKVIEFYVGFLNAEHNVAFFDKLFTSSAVKKMETLGKTFGMGHYRIAVELATLSHLLAAQMEVEEYELRELRDECAAEVKALDRNQTFTEVYRSEHQRDWEGR